MKHVSMTVFFFWEPAWYEHPDLLAILPLSLPLSARALQPNPNLLSPQNNLLSPGQMLPDAFFSFSPASFGHKEASVCGGKGQKHIIRDWGHESDEHPDNTDTMACPFGGVRINRVPLSYTWPVTRVTFACVHYFFRIFCAISHTNYASPGLQCLMQHWKPAQRKEGKV